MQKAELVLTKLNQKSEADKNFIFKRLYRNLYNPDFYLNAYGKIYHKEGNMTAGATSETIDGFSITKIKKIITELKEEKYYPYPVRRTYIEKKNSKKKRPLGIPIFKDKLVQEVLRQILEAIYEPQFSKNSHGFRPGKSCQTALDQVRSCRGTCWVIEGDITGFFDNIDHNILLEILKRKIDDGRIIELIRRFLKAGYIENEITRDSITGTPQGGIISPILANIYLNELDTYMETVMKENNKGTRRKRSNEYYKLRTIRNLHSRHGRIELVKEYEKKMKNIPSGNQFDTEFKRLKYIRYADDFVICIIGSKSMAEQAKDNVAKFLYEKLKLELNKEKTLITNITKNSFRFLGYKIHKAVCNTKMIKEKSGKKRRSVNGQIQLRVPSEVISDKIKGFTEKGKPIHHKERKNLSINEIINRYNTEIYGLYNFYCMANNVSQQLYRFKYYHYYSMVRTIAAKKNSSVKKVIKKYGIDVPRKDGTGTLKVVGIKYVSGGKEKTYTYFNKPIKKIRKPNTIDILPDVYFRSHKGEIVRRLLKSNCEVCRTKKDLSQIEVHHVKKLRHIKEKYVNNSKNPPEWALLMCKIRRKTLIVCIDCHKRIHDEI